MSAKIFLIFMLFTKTVYAANYNYNKLRFMEYNELRQIKSSAISASRKFKYPRQSSKTIEPLKEAMKMFFSRPNEDNLTSALVTDIESELESLNAYPSTLESIINENLTAIENKKLSPEERTTAALAIKNLLLEIKPKIVRNTELAKVVCKLADKSIKLPKDIQKSSMIQTLYLEKSPSTVAKEIMLWYAKTRNIKTSSQPNNGCPFSKRAT